MSLSTALDTAKSSLAASQAQTAILSRNIANVGVAGATKKTATIVTGAGGGVRITSVAQSANGVLYGNMLEAKAAVGRSNVIANGLDRLNETIGDTKLGRSPAAMISKLTAALNTLSATPGNYELARNAQLAASDLVTTITSGSETVQSIRRDADKELVNAAADMTRILAKIESLNKEVTTGTRTGADVTDLSDERDRAVAELSQYVSVTVRTRGDNDMVLYTDSGVTLFETTARTVEFTQTPGLNATVEQGNAFRIDGIPVTGDTAYMPLKGGSVAGLVALRDDVMNTYQTQLDEIARGLIDATKETMAGQPYKAGLFTSSDPAALATISSLSLGKFDAGTLIAGDKLSFDLTYEGTTYNVSGALTAGDIATPQAFAAAMQRMIEGPDPLPAGSPPTLGGGKITVSADAAGQLTLLASNIGSYAPVSIGKIVGFPATSTLPLGTFDTGTLADGDKLSFDLAYDGKTYNVSGTLAAADIATPAAFAAAVQRMIEGPVPLPAGSPPAVGLGKITIAADGSGNLTLTAANQANYLPVSISRIVGVPANAVAGAPGVATKDGGLVAGMSSTPIVASKDGGLAAGTSLRQEKSVVGLAASLQLAAGVKENPQLLRDGVAYAYNPPASVGATAAGGFTGRLNEILNALAATQSFSSASGADPSASIADYAASSISWLQALRQNSLAETEYKTTLLQSSETALSNETGVNMDEQLTRLTEIQRSYQASAKLISTIDEMLATLLQSI